MMRSVASAVLVVLVGSSASVALAGEGFAHVQTDKPQYRLGETIWYRVHVRAAAAGLSVSLVRPDGSVAAKKTELDGSFVLAEDAPGGEYRVRVEAGGAVLHEVKLAAYDLASRQLDLSLVVLGELYEPGDEVTATLAVRDLKGSPVEGARVAYAATFGPLVVQAPGGVTDAEGRALVRFTIPRDAQRSGSLAVGVDAGKRLGAVARPVVVSSGVARIDALPEGGSVLPGGRQRFGLLARDLDGEPALCEGRVRDDRDATVAVFRTDRRGVAAVDFLYEKDRTYRIELDRPSSAKGPFALPGPTGHAYALRAESKGFLTMVVRGKKGPATLVVVRGDGKVVRERIEVTEDGTTTPIPSSDIFEVERVILEVEGRAYLATAVLGGVRHAGKVEVKAETRGLPGDLVQVVVTATDAQGMPLSCDLALSAVNEGAAPPSTSCGLPVRALLSDATGEPAPDLAGLDEAELHAWLLVHGALAFPPEGVPSTERKLAEPARPRLPAIAARPPVELPAGGKSLSKGTALDRLIQCAPFTRFALPREATDESFGLAVEEGALPDLAPRGKLPQEATSLRFDCRDTLLWRARIKTDKDGHATATFKLSHEVSPLVVSAQGFASQGAPVAGLVLVKPRAAFTVKTPFPSRVTVGDIFESFVSLAVLDGEQLPLQVLVVAPPCLRALERTELTFDPRTSARDQKFRFEVVAPAHEARIQVIATRGAFRSVSTRTVTAGYREVELSFGRSGFDRTGQACSVKIPADAVPGSVSATTRVATTTTASTQDSVEKLLSEPHGCFEQTTAANYPNLVVLEALMKRGTDPSTLERATLLVRAGFERLLRFQDPATGGFSLWDHTVSPQPHYSAMAVLQLAHYARLFQGKGSLEMRRAIAYLDGAREPLEQRTALYVAFAAAEAGYAWPRARKLLEAAPATSYERGLLACLVASWPGEWPLAKPRATLLDELVRRLEQDQDSTTGGLAAEGAGVMGSTGRPYSVETTALAALAFAAANHGGSSLGCARFLEQARDPNGYWGGTQATVLAIRALAAFGAARKDETVLVSFSANGRALAIPAGERGRPLVVARSLDAAPGSTVKLGLDFKTADPLSYSVACRYRVANPRSSEDAPYRIETSLPGTVVNEVALVVVLKRIRKDVSGQVVAKIAIPGGCEPVKEKLAKLGGSSNQEMVDGFLVLYWEEPPGDVRFEVPLAGKAAGDYVTAPSVVYPYYESGREAFAPGRETHVLAPYDMNAAGGASGAAAPRGK